MKVVVAPTGLRAMAKALQKHTKTNGDCIVNLYITSYKEGNKKLKTIGIELNTAKKITITKKK